jgi:hypothetical protein
MVTDIATVNEDDQPNAEQPLTEAEWRTLVDSVIKGRCTPFLGAGVAVPDLPTGTELAATLAKQFGYPLADPTNLPRVAQYVATRHHPWFAKGQVKEQIIARRDKFIESSDVDFPQNYRMLANLRLPIYITTNYDDFLTRALNAAGRTPQVEVCRWNNWPYEDITGYSENPPTEKNPLIFHLHGELSDEDSLLVTEDDYIDFTVSLSQPKGDEEHVIPHWVRRALGRTTLLFVGYSLEDWNFRILMRQLIKQLGVQRHQQAPSISIQLSDTKLPPNQRLDAQRYLADYLHTTSGIRVHWGPAAPFLKELDERSRKARGRQ